MIPLLRYHQSEMKVSLELCSPREALALKSVSVVMTEVLAFLLAFSWANYQLLQDAFFFWLMAVFLSLQSQKWQLKLLACFVSL